MKKIDSLVSVALLVVLFQNLWSGNCCAPQTELDYKIKQVEEKLKTMPAWKLRFLYSRTSSQDYKAYLGAEEQAMFKQTVKKIARVRRDEMASAVFSAKKSENSQKKDCDRHVSRDIQRKKQLAKYN